jgi:Lrp/AsnC family leucine-responsive transcriptional regulator
MTEIKPNHSSKSDKKGRTKLKEIELRLVSELMRNSRRSDRALAKALGVSQPTISRMINKLEKTGVIREYTTIPDFGKLGYEIMGITSISVREQVFKEGIAKIRVITGEVEKIRDTTHVRAYQESALKRLLPLFKSARTTLREGAKP